jgi:dynein heavy chain
MIICMSPLSSLFSPRLRQFPSLVNCCTLDWFSEWPEEALLGVGKGALQESEQELGLEDQALQLKLVEMFKNIHKSVEKYSVRFYNELKRNNYVTPTSYLELLSLYKVILQQKRVELSK